MNLLLNIFNKIYRHILDNNDFSQKCREDDPTLITRYKPKKTERSEKTDRPKEKDDKKHKKNKEKERLVKYEHDTPYDPAHSSIKKSSKRCGECSGCVRSENCGKCDACR